MTSCPDEGEEMTGKDPLKCGPARDTEEANDNRNRLFREKARGGYAAS
jgi:hypothetical protein